MGHRILKMGVCKINLSHFTFCEGIQHLPAKDCCICIRWVFHDLRCAFYNVISTACKHICTFSTDGINVQILFVEITLCDQFHNITVVSTGKSPVRGDHNNCFSIGISRIQIWVIDIATLGKHGSNRFVHIVEIRIGLFCPALCLLQFNGRNELHRFGDLLRT